LGDPQTGEPAAGAQLARGQHVVAAALQRADADLEVAGRVDELVHAARHRLDAPVDARIGHLG
jgi:hypothetical protein